MKFKAVIFDLDGTLLNTLDDLADSCNQVLEKNGFPTHTIDEVRMFVGNGLGVLIEKALPSGKENPQYQKVLQEMRETYANNWQNKTRAYDGVLDLINELSSCGVKMGIVSNKPDAQVKELASLYFKGIPASCAIGEKESEGIKRKPSPDSVFAVLKKLGVEKHEALYVGDSDVDIKTANNAGLFCVSVLWGFRSEDFLKANGAKCFIKTPSELLEIVL